jgi:hypothetical protein
MLATLLAAPAARAGGEYEPNDSYDAATGPILAGTTYAAGFETLDDVDEFFFYLPQATTLSYTITATGAPTPDNAACISLSQQTSEDVEDTEFIDDTDLVAEPGQTVSNSITLDRGKYFANVWCGEDFDEVDDNTGTTYTFRLEPAGSTTTYEPFAAQCAAATPPLTAASAAKTAAAAAFQKVERKLKAAKAAHKPKRKIHKLKARMRKRKSELKTAKAAYRDAAAQAAYACGVPQ